MSRIVNRVGETNIASNGMKMTIINYINNNNIDIQFADGTIIRKKKYCHFKIGNIQNPNCVARIENRKNKYIGLENVANNGQKMKIIDYKDNHNIDIQFEDGNIVKGKCYSAFKRGKIENPNFTFKAKTIGSENIASNGQKMKLIEYRTTRDIDVQFEDGTIVKHKNYSAFKTGNIENPNLRTHQVYEGVGAVAIARNGLSMTIIKYKNCEDIDVQFEDGAIVTHKAYYNFLEGRVGNPNLKNHSGIIYSENYFGYQIREAFRYNNKVYFEAYKNDEFIALMTLQEIYQAERGESND